MEIQVLLQSSLLPLPPPGTPKVGPDWRLRQFLFPHKGSVWSLG